MIATSGAMALTAVLWLALVRDRTVRLPHARLRDVFALAANPAVRNVGAVHFLLFGGYLALLGILPRALLRAGLPPRPATIAIAAWLTPAPRPHFVWPLLSDPPGRR